jgi:hypothetical protein
MFLTLVAVLLDLAPKLMDRQIIRLFETGEISSAKGRHWGYLMCFGAAGLRLMSFIMSNYSEYVTVIYLLAPTSTPSMPLIYLRCDFVLSCYVFQLSRKLPSPRSSQNENRADAVFQAAPVI